VNHKHGHLNLIFGPMFSGKSSELQRTVRRYEISKKACLLVNYALDSRYSSEDVVSTHDK
jgi:thymidine kinase